MLGAIHDFKIKENLVHIRNYILASRKIKIGTAFHRGINAELMASGIQHPQIFGVQVGFAAG